MMLLNNEYSKLLLYLENLLDQNIDSTSKKPKIVESKPSENLNKNVIDKTRRIIEECQEIYSDIPLAYDSGISSSKGFDIKKFENLMKSKLIDEYKRLQSYERPYISVSELYSCLRSNYYNRKRYSINVDDKFNFTYLYLIQKVGNEIHELVQNLYDFTEVEKTIVSEKFKVKGRADALKNEYLYEIKSIDPLKFKNKYDMNHYYQALIYAYILNSEYNYNIKYVTILYVLRNLKKVYPFDLPINDKIAKSFLNRAILLRNSLDKNIVPDPIGSSEEQCKFCLFKKYCDKDEIKDPKLVTKKKKEPSSKSVFLF